MREIFTAINASPDLQYVAIRAFILFILGILVIRFGNRRYQLNSAIDFLMVVLFGSILARGINGLATMMSSIVAMLTLILSHKFLAQFTTHFKVIEDIFKGRRYLLIDKGKIQHKTLKSVSLTTRDLEEHLHEKLCTDDFNEVYKAYLERNGSVSFIKKNQTSM